MTIGGNISKDDLDALATKANAKSSLTKKVDPCYNDGTGTAYGHKRFSGVKIDPANAGAGYFVGDVLSLGFSSKFEVVAVSPFGAVRGIRVVNPGAGQYNDPTWNGTTGTQIANSGGSGTGCQLLYDSFSQYGPTMAYGFADFIPTAGKVTGYYLVAGGTGYAVGDYLVFVEQPGTLLAVASVDGSGAVLTFDLDTLTSLTVVPQNIKAMAATGSAGTGAVFGGFYTLGPNPQWITELNRMRYDLWTALRDSVTEAEKHVSGPWPVSSFGTAGFDPNSPDQAFYYVDTGHAENVTLASSTSHVGKAYSYTHGGVDSNRVVASSQIKFKLRCPPGTTLSGTAVVYAHAHDESFTTTPVPGLTVTSNFGGFTYIEDGRSPTPGTSYGRYICTFSGLGDGDYEVNVSGGVGYSDGSYNCMWDLTYGNFGTLRANVAIWGNFIGVTYYGALTNGLHGTKDVYKIQIPPMDFPLIGYGINAIYRDPLPGETFGPTNPDVQPSFGPERNYVNFASSLTASVNGFWCGKTTPISDLRAVTPEYMPWNQTRSNRDTGGSIQVNPMLMGDGAPSVAGVPKQAGSYNQGLPIEYQTELPPWVASRYFGAGFKIIADGNLWVVNTAGTTGLSQPIWPRAEGATIIDGGVTWSCYRLLLANPATLWSVGSWAVGYAITDSNGNTQVVIAPGTTGATAPVWAQVAGARTADGSVVWEMRSQLVAAPHRPNCVAPYPVYWASETDPRLKPPTSTSGLTILGAYGQWRGSALDSGWQQDNLAKGWWIYSLSLNRFQITGSEITVRVGCMRNGSFVEFGSYLTGQTVRVMWPVFTSDALVYQADERVDIHAVAIAAGAGGVLLAPLASGEPMCTSFIADPDNLLNLLA